MGKLNLLHHKSWHVWKRDNLEIVRKDEEKAAAIKDNKDERTFEIVIQLFSYLLSNTVFHKTRLIQPIH